MEAILFLYSVEEGAGSTIKVRRNIYMTEYEATHSSSDKVESLGCTMSV